MRTLTLMATLLAFMALSCGDDRVVDTEVGVIVTSQGVSGRVELTVDYSSAQPGEFRQRDGELLCTPSQDASLDDVAAKRLTVYARPSTIPARLITCTYRSFDGMPISPGQMVVDVDVFAGVTSSGGPLRVVIDTDLEPLSTTTTTMPIPTTTTTLPDHLGGGVFEVEFRVGEGTFAALQIEVDYSALLPGGFVGRGIDVSCRGALNNPALSGLNHDETAAKLHIGSIALPRFSGPHVVFICEFEHPERKPNPSDFRVRVVDAVDFELRTIGLDVAVLRVVRVE